MVEFAILLPAFVLLFVVAADFGRIFFTWVQVTNAAREGAAYAAGNPTDTSGITARAVAEAGVQSQGGQSAITVSTSCADAVGAATACSAVAGGGGIGNTITVAVSEVFSFLTPGVSNIVGHTATLTGSSTAVVTGLAPNAGGSQPPACPAPTLASFTVGGAALTLNVDASASAPNSGQCAISGYNWDWGDNVNAFPPITGVQASYTYAAGGVYLVVLEVTNQGGTLSTSRTVTVPILNPSPSPACNTVPSFTFNELGNSGKFDFSGAYTGSPAPASWAWTFGDGATDTGQNPARHNYGGSGPYTVTLTVTNGACQRTTSQSVTP